MDIIHRLMMIKNTLRTRLRLALSIGPIRVGTPPLLPDDGDRFQSQKRRVFLIIIRRWIMSMKFVIILTVKSNCNVLDTILS
jgi:hypothetical protein